MKGTTGTINGEIPVMHCFDNNYVIPAAVSFFSMLKNADQRYFYRLFVLHSDITIQNQQKLIKLVRGFGNADLEFIDMNNQFKDLWKAMPNTDHLSKEVLYKLVASVIFPQYDKLIITDVDVVFLGDIAPSINSFNPDDDVYFAGVRQINPDKSFLRDYYEGYKKAFSSLEYSQIKVCGGYLVANLKKQREDRMVDVFVSYLKNNADRLLQAEQDVINFCCRERQIVMLPLNYVVCSYMYDICTSVDITTSDPYYTYREMTDAMAYPIQLHYATKTKPWNSPDSTKAEIWFEYLKQTNFVEDYNAQKLYEKERISDLPGKLLFPELPKSSSVKISVLVCTYNHQELIGKALESILTQKTNYPFELIVSDDASTDGTQEIIQAYHKRYPDKMKKCILRTQNVGIGKNYYEALTLAEGEYLAICDGDDYWLDENKLQKQVDFLEKNKEYSIACSDFLMHTVGEENRDKQFGIKGFLENSCGLNPKYTLSNLIESRFIASCTVVLRWKLKDCVPEFLKEYKVIDFPLELIHASCGYIKVFYEPMSVYNLHPQSISHTDHNTVQNDALILLKEVNQFLGFKITPHIKAYLQRLTASQGSEPAPQDLLPKVYKPLERLYAKCMPEFGKRIYRSFKKGLKYLYRKLVPVGLRQKITPAIRRIKNN